MQFLCTSPPLRLHLSSPDKALAYSAQSATVFLLENLLFFVINVASTAAQAF